MRGVKKRRRAPAGDYDDDGDPVPHGLLKAMPPPLFFGADEMHKALQSQKLHLDSWFTGCDFPSIAMQQLSTAIRRRLSWFVHENVIRFPGKYITDEFEPKYQCEESVISPQRFGKPMNRQPVF
eukprot:Skav207665  [mRNA]  locus=scaffold1857:174390:176482:+ [translate_table: standard]